MNIRPLTELLDTHAAGENVPLPLHPSVARQGRELLAAGMPALPALTQLISHDPVLTCSLFRAANSAFYLGLPRVMTIHDALTRIGLERVSASLSQDCHAAGALPAGSLLANWLPELWRHALGCALGARWLAARCGYQTLADQAHLAGLLHDIGKIALLATLHRCETVDTAGERLSASLVEEVLVSRHVAEGVRLMTAWNLPPLFATIAARHHETALDAQDVVGALVRLANQGCHKLGLGGDANPDRVLPTTAEAQFLGLDEIALAEFEIMLEDRFQLGEETLSQGIGTAAVCA